MSELPPPPSDEGPPDIPPPPDQTNLRARNLGEIIAAAFDIYINNAGQLLLIVALVVVPVSILSYLITEVVLQELPLLAVLVGSVVGTIISAILQAALVRGAAEATIGEPIDIGASYRWGLRRFGSVLFVSLLVGIAVFVGALPGVLIALAVPFLGIIIVLAGIFVLAAYFSVTIPALVVEDLRGTRAMRRSWELVSGHFWHVLGVIVTVIVLTGLVGGLIGSIGGNNDVVRAIFGAIAQIIVAPFAALVSVLLYLELRARKENLTPSSLRADLGTSELGGLASRGVDENGRRKEDR